MRYFFRYVIFIGFTFLFFSLFLFLPHEEVSKQENRTLAPKPVLFQNSTLNLNFGSDLDAYLKDHFPHRKNLISSYLRGRYIIGGRLENKYAIVGKNGWMFYKNNAFRNSTYKENELKKISEKLNKLNRLLKENGITFFVFVPPSYQRVYSEYIKPYCNIDEFLNKALELNKNVQKNTDVIFLYPLEEMKSWAYSYPYPLYQKCDSHPSGYGYYVLYRLLMNELKKNYPSLEIFNVDAFVEKKRIATGSTCRALGFHEPQEMFPDLLHKEKFVVRKDKKGSYAYWKNVYEPGRYNLFFLGSSMGLEIHKMMIPSFKTVIFMRDNIENSPDNTEDIFPDLLDILKQEKIDIFILEMPEDRIISHRFSERLDDILNSYKD